MEPAAGGGDVGERREEGLTWEEYIRTAAVESVRHGLSLQAFWTLTPADYGVMRDGWELAALDEDYKTAQLAWMTARAGDKRRVGNEIRLVHTSFKEFFDYSKKEEDLRKKQDVRAGRREPGDPALKRLSQHMARKRKGGTDDA